MEGRLTENDPAKLEIGLPFTNVANGCATGGSALMSACHAIKSGEFDIGLVVGFDQHERRCAAGAGAPSRQFQRDGLGGREGLVSLGITT